uniref:MULE transposase domain-containing protein n=1 Tax=Brassica oleracea var. oleracea TaxID=109376 RepID=A0A0D3DMH5_BRAOL
MAESQEIELKIHFGGSVKKIGKEDYDYLEKEEMKQLQYVYDRCDEEMLMLRSVSKLGIDVVEVFVEHECSEHIPGVIQLPDREHIEDEEHSENDEVDRPKEDDEPEGSEDENPAEKEDNPTVNPAEKEDNEDGGDEVVADVTDGISDVRFQSVFEEGEKVVPDKEAYGNGIEEEDKDDDSEDERAPVDVEYPDTPVESEDEWEEWNREHKGKGKVNGSDKYHGDYEKPPYIWLFQKFNSGIEFKDQLLKYSMNTQYDVKMPINKWMVKVCHMKHNHGKSSRISVLKQGVIADLFREELRRNVNLQASAIKDAIKVRCDIVVPISKCYRGRHIALGKILEAQTTQFGKLWDYEEELRRSNQGISINLCTREINGVQMFDCFYICFKELRTVWKSCCRPVIGLDRCFLKWDFNGDFLAAVGRDADNRMYPIAWAVVRGENKDTWGWFVRKLKHDLGLEFGKDLTVISDKQKGLVHAIELELPEAEHRMCARHIYANWKKLGFSRSEFKSLFWGVAYSYTEGEYKEKMHLVEAYDVVAHNELLKTDPERWCRAFFNVESHCPDVHNNLSESFNRTIKMARAKPMINMLEDIRRQAMKKISRRFFMVDKWDTIVTPITMALLEKARCAKKHCSTILSSFSLYEVNEFDCGYRVDLAAHQWACRRWDLTDDKKPPIGIPEIRKPRGRPRTRERKKEPFEVLETAGKSSRHGRIPTCSNCHQSGHIKTGCKNKTVVYEGPKNKRGRPRKNLEEPPSTRRRKTQNTGSSSQPVHATESSSQSVHATGSSSQPVEATGSSNPKPHAKKPSRGPLKVRKTANIPHGVGTLWSPFTNPPFEVFGDRVYDRSDLNPQPPQE